MSSRTLLLTCWVLSGCQCGVPVQPIPLEPLEVPAALDFGTVYVGQRATRTLAITNPARVRQPLSIEAPTAPFTLDAPEPWVPASDALHIAVHFAPTTPGPWAATLRADEHPVHLTGVALPVPTCEPLLCAETTFDVETGACVAVNQPDDTPCEAACAEAGRCIAGQCLSATGASCDDSDACTLDACGASGCQHHPVRCEVTDPCRVARCDPALGCVSEPVEDGVSCGAQADTCEFVNLCLSGVCTSRRRAAVDDCRYTTLSSSEHHSCARTVSGVLRCWGDSLATAPTGISGLGVSYYFEGHPPVALPVTGDVFATKRFSTLIARSGGGVTSIGDRPPPDAGAQFTAITCAGYWSDRCSGLLADGSALSWKHFFGTVDQLAQGPYVAVSGEFALTRPDGGLTTLAGDYALPGPVRDVVDGRGRYVLLADGRVLRAGLPAQPAAPFTEISDAGAHAISVWNLLTDTWVWRVAEWVCEARPQGLLVCFEPTGLEVFRQQLPEAIAAMSGACARTVSGRVFCTQLHPPQLRPITVAEGAHLLDGNLLAWRTDEGQVNTVRKAAYRFDGGAASCATGDDGIAAQRSCVRNLGLQPEARALVSLGGAIGGTMLLANGDVVQWDGQQVVARNVREMGAWSITTDGFIVQPYQGPTSMRALQTSAVALVFEDGGVVAPSLGFPSIGLGAVRTLGDDRCAVMQQGTITCWDPEPDGGTRFTSPPGVRLFPRQVTGTAEGGCALTALNGVQCWGVNITGQLGRVGPSSDRAVDVPVREAVVKLRRVDGSVCLETQSGKIQCWGADVLRVPSDRLQEVTQ